MYPRALVDCSKGSTALTLFGEHFAHPALLAPVSFQRLAHPDGELATAQAASALETGMVLSTLSSVSLEAVARELSTNRWFQLYFQSDRARTLELVRRAERAGYSALVVTVDAPVTGMQYRAQRAGFRLPADVTAVNLKHSEPATVSLEPGQSRVFQGAMRTAPGWQNVDWLREQTHLPIILKGLLHRDDVAAAVRHGIDGVVLSNHGGRTLGNAPAALAVLPEIRASVGVDYPLLIDGGIRTGSDVFVSLALGATAVLLGRPQVYALAVNGAQGVARMLRILRDELEVTMALAGCTDLASISPACLLDRQRLEA